MLSEIRQERSILINVGNNASKSYHPESTELPQQRRKSALQQQSINLHSPQVRAIGPMDVSIGLEYLLKDIKGPILASNIKCDGVSSFVDHQISTIDNTKIGFLSLWSSSKSAETCTTLDPVEASKKIINSVSADIWVLISHMSPTEASTVLEHSKLGIVIDALSLQVQPPKRHQSGSVLVGAGGRGKRIGQMMLVVDQSHRHFEVDGAREELNRSINRLTARLETLEASTTDRAIRQRAIFQNRIEEAKARLKEFDSLGTGSFFEHSVIELSKSIEASPRIERLIAEAKQDFVALASAQPHARYVGDFVGSDSCQACHSSIYEQWQATAHSKAWSTLLKVDRALDNECYSCHITGGFSADGPRSPMSLRAEGQPHDIDMKQNDIEWGPLVNVGCESCHGKGGVHILQPSKENITRKVWRFIVLLVKKMVVWRMR